MLETASHGESGLIKRVLSAEPRRRLARELGRLALVALAYWLAARLSLSLALVHGQVTPIWPSTGIALVAILVVGRRVWPAITIAALAVNLPLGPTPAGAVCIAIGNTLAPLAAAELLRRVGFEPGLDRLRDAAALILLGALLGMSISATVGSAVLVLAGAVSMHAFWSTWAVWWTGDAMGVLLVTPFLLSLLSRSRGPLLSGRQRAELVAWLAATGVVTYLVFQLSLRLEYVVLPLVMSVAWRFRLRGAAPAALLASGVAVWATAKGSGPYAGEALFQKMVALQAFNVSVALASFVLAAFVGAQRRKEEMSRLYLAAQATSEAKSAFLNMAGHELRTPLSVVSGYLSILSEGSLGPAPQGWSRPLEILVTKTNELNRIVDDLLEAARIEAGALPPSPSQLNLRTLVQEAVKRSRPRADLLGAEIAASLGPEPIPIRADLEQVGRILDNLINNGLTYCTRPPRLLITASAGPKVVVVQVADNGVGIPESQFERVFDRFFRGEEPDLHNIPGTGLGLYISRHLAEEHGGSLKIVKSRMGEGTVFGLTLPVMEAAAVDQADPPRPPRNGVRRSSRQAGVR